MLVFEFFFIILGRPHKGIGLLFIFTIILLSFFYIFTTSTITSLAIAVIWKSAFNSRSSHLLDWFHGSIGFSTLTTVINSQLVRYVRFEVDILCLQSCLLISLKNPLQRKMIIDLFRLEKHRKWRVMAKYALLACPVSSNRLNKLQSIS